jgi:hypothetical protein
MDEAKKMMLVGIKKDPRSADLSKLPDLDSNQDKQNQNLSYYHYTIGQSFPNGDAKISYPLFCAKCFLKELCRIKAYCASIRK